MPHELIQAIRTDEALWSALVDLCDFDARWPTDESDIWFELADARPIRAIGGDASGGRYVLVAQPLPCEHSAIYVSSEGLAGTIARDIPTMLALLVTVPYWEDCLRFSADGDLPELRRAAAYLESELLAENPDADSQRHVLRHRLQLSPLQDPIQLLHAAVSASPMIVSRAEREACESLFGKFSIPPSPPRTG